MRRCTAALLVAAVCFLVGQTPTDRAAASGAFTAAPCPFSLGAGLRAGRDVRCGYLTVPEVRGRRSSRQIRLAVAIFKSPASKPRPDPVFYLHGGPGVDIVQSSGPEYNSQNVQYLVGDRDLILFDQRGVAPSSPSLNCPEFSDLQRQDLDRSLSQQTQMRLEVAAMGRCADRLRHAGIDLGDYATLPDAQDVLALQQALGYREINLYGDSYGSRLALTIMRLHPRGIRSVVLDGPYPPEANLFSDRMQSAARAFNLLLHNCAHSSHCPHNLTAALYTSIARLDAHPVTITATSPLDGRRHRVLLDGSSFLGTRIGLFGTLFYGLYDDNWIPLLPGIIEDIYHGSYRRIAALYSVVGFGFKGTSWGDYYSTLCAEDAPFTSTKAIDASVRLFPAPIQANLRVEAEGRLAVCHALRLPAVPVSFRRPASSAIPTLILEGEYDPISPPLNGALAGERLSNAYTYLFPGVGHGARYTGYCPNAMVLAFFDSPRHRPNSSCLQGLTDPFSG